MRIVNRGLFSSQRRQYSPSTLKFGIPPLWYPRSKWFVHLAEIGSRSHGTEHLFGYNQGMEKKNAPSRPDFSTRLAALATRPGVYLMKDADDTIIYVGKAISLRNRVRSYFQSQRHKDPKTRELVKHITDFEVIRTDTAEDTSAACPSRSFPRSAANAPNRAGLQPCEIPFMNGEEGTRFRISPLERIARRPWAVHGDPALCVRYEADVAACRADS